MKIVGAVDPEMRNETLYQRLGNAFGLTWHGVRKIAVKNGVHKPRIGKVTDANREREQALVEEGIARIKAALKATS